MSTAANDDTLSPSRKQGKESSPKSICKSTLTALIIFAATSNLACWDSTLSMQTPEAPTDLQVTKTASGTVSLAWKDNSSNEANFEILRSDSAGHLEIAAILPENTTTHTDTYLMPSHEYKYKVRAVAVSDDGLSHRDSPYSEPVTARTKPYDGVPLVPPSVLAVLDTDNGCVTIGWEGNYDVSNPTRIVLSREAESGAGYALWWSAPASDSAMTTCGVWQRQTTYIMKAYVVNVVDQVRGEFSDTLRFRYVGY